MKTVSRLAILTLLLIQVTAFAQVTETDTVTENSPHDIETKLSELSTEIDLYFSDMISLKTRTLKPTASAENNADLTLLENRRQKIIDSIKAYRSKILELSANSDSLVEYDNAKFLLNIVLIKSYLPRLETAKTGLAGKVKSLVLPVEPQRVSELITRNEANDLFFKEFVSNDTSKNGFDADFRLNSIVQTHNNLATVFNKMNGSQLLQVYPKRTEVSTNLQEAAFYDSIIRGQEFKPAVAAPAPGFLELNKVSDGVFSLTLTCAGLFAY